MTTAMNLEDYISPETPAVRANPHRAALREFLGSNGLGFRVETSVLAMADNGGRHVRDWVATYRGDNGRDLGVVSRLYPVFQNEDALGILADVAAQAGDTDGTAVEYSDARALHGGAIVSASAMVKRATAEVVPGDVVTAGVRVRTGHDGETPFTADVIVVRGVCRNGLTRTVEERLFKLRHTGRGEDRMKQARELLAASLTTLEKAVEEYRRMQRKRVEADEIMAYLRAVVPDPADETAKRARKNAERIRDEIFELLNIGQGTDIPGVRGTMWGAYNAVTEWVDHHRRPTADDDTRFEVANYGVGAALKVTALTEALRRT